MLVQNLPVQNTNPELSYGINMKFRTFSSQTKPTLYIYTRFSNHTRALKP